jgi:hypothetical protein
MVMGLRWHERRRLSLVLALALGGAVVAAVASRPGSEEPAATPPATAPTVASNPINEWLSADGMARAAALRTSLGLRADDAWIRFVATDPRALANVERYSIPMLDTEVAHVDDRETLIAALARFGSGHVDVWGGYYFAGNIVVVMLVDPTGSVEQELHAAIPQPLVVMPARWSFQELTDLANRIADDPWLKARYDLLSAGADVERNCVALEVSSADPAAPAAIARHFNLGNQLIVTSDGTGEGNAGPPNG